MSRSGADLALLLLGGYRSLVDTATSELARRGYEDFKPIHEFALRAIVAGADSASIWAAALPYRSRQRQRPSRCSLSGDTWRADPIPTTLDASGEVTSRGFDVMAQGEAILAAARAEWVAQIGASELAEVEARLSALVGDAAIRIDAPGWAAQEAQ